MPAFDELIRLETNFGLNLRDFCHSNIGWFVKDANLLEAWGGDSREGVYLLWAKTDYCEVHERYHMQSLYVGKGRIMRRLYRHWVSKDFPSELVYWTFLELPNRKAKYVEQLFLDLFRFSLNKAENRGGEKLCAYFTQEEVD